MIVLLIVVPLLLAFLSILIKKHTYLALVLGMVSNLVVLSFAQTGVVSIGNFGAYGISLLLDQYALLALWIVNGLFFIISMSHCKAMKKMTTVLLVLLAGLNGLLLTHDLFNLFVFLEITGIATYLLTIENNRPLRTFNYLVQGTIGSGLYLLGLIMLYAMVGTLNMSQIFQSILQNQIVPEQLIIPFLFMFVGLGVEAKLLPFNAWAKGVLEKAKPLSGTIITSVIAGTVLLVFGRLVTTVMIVGPFKTVLVIILLATIIGGEVAAFRSTKLREILLFSSVAQAGLVMYLFVSGLLMSAILLVVANMISKFILFNIGSTLAEQFTDDVTELRGIFQSNKLLGLSFTVAALSVAGLPLFFGFFIKLNILMGMMSSGDLITPIIILVISLIEGVYLIRLVVGLWSGRLEHTFKNRLMLISTTVAAGSLIVLGVYYQLLTDFMNNIQTEMLLIMQGGLF